MKAKTNPEQDYRSSEKGQEGLMDCQNQRISPTLCLVVILLTCVMGCVDTLYLTMQHLFGGASCSGGGECNKVLGSSFSSIAGIPLASLGLAWYSSMAYLIWSALLPLKGSPNFRFIRLWSIVGVFSHALLIILQAFVIKAWCVYCLASAFLCLTIFLLLTVGMRRSRCVAVERKNVAFWRYMPSFVTILILIPISFAFLKSKIESLGSGQLEPNPVVARIGERGITRQELKNGVKLEAYIGEEKFRKEWLKNQILEYAAGQQGLSLDSYLIKNVFDHVDVSAMEVQEELTQSRGSMPLNLTAEEAKQQIYNYLGKKKGEEAVTAHVEVLKERFGFSYTPPADEKFIVDPNPRGAPEKGSLDAPITLVVFSDFNCNYCGELDHEIAAYLAENPSELRVVYKQFPLPENKNSKYLAQIAIAAAQIGKYWEFEQELFSADGENFSKQDLEAICEHLGVDLDTIEKGSASEAVLQLVEEDIKEGKSIGIQSTPAVFINGKYQAPFNPRNLKNLIEREKAFLGL